MNVLIYNRIFVMSVNQRPVTQSAWGVIYYLTPDGDPRYLLIKRQAMSKKIEWVCPKGKVESWETHEQAAIREVGEETGLSANYLEVMTELWQTHIRTDDPSIGRLNKDITLFLMLYTGDPSEVTIIEWEWYIGIYKRCTLQQVLALIYYPDLRELIRQSYGIIKADVKKDTVKQDFLESL